ncbi:class I SAM-dependent methyltransferase [Anthocerotibacter panamensis]|uniref:class I SAM-dependent methyltransferase n=1 Tax=Anthocerotibacter panamensis TaxID=2857077 RepID=UPI001C405BF2|nr:class I SAM-dependent methyltransferase [Anthocerotibacter panamensis]
MATLLRTWAFRYPWLYDCISWTTAWLVGGEGRLRQLPLRGVPALSGQMVLDLCCGSGLSSQTLVGQGARLTGLDCSVVAIHAARERIPSATFVQGRAERLPFPEATFDLVHTSLALHEMSPGGVLKICQEVYRVLKPGGVFVLLDFHCPANPLFWPGLALFLWIFETQTSWQLIQTDLRALLRVQGFESANQTLYAGGSLQVLQAHKRT